MINIYSEIEPLKKVLLHKPGKELENLMPDYLLELLFDDIPYLHVAIEEHDAFAKILHDNNVQIYYLEELAAEVFADASIREQFFHDFLKESKIIKRSSIYNHIWDMYQSLDAFDFTLKCMEGLQKLEIDTHITKKYLTDFINSNYPFYLNPMPNLYFTRDPAAAIGKGIALNTMNKQARKRETLFLQYIITHHPSFANVPLYFNRNYTHSIEGGDQLILTEQTLAIGISERSSAEAIEELAYTLFSNDEKFNTILAIEIPKSHAFMHLDTVFTMIDHNRFTVHPEVEQLLEQKAMTLYTLEKTKNNDITVTQHDNLLKGLKKVLNTSAIDLIPCGGGNPVIAAREQWNDGSNTLAIAPGTVITYARNYVTNDILRREGITVLEIPSAELSRGRGGPRCMSMPLMRQ